MVVPNNKFGLDPDKNGYHINAELKKSWREVVGVQQVVSESCSEMKPVFVV